MSNLKLITKETALLAKEAGCDWRYDDFYLYKGELPQFETADAFPQELLVKWIREERDIQVYVKPLPSKQWSGYVDQWGHHLLTEYLIDDSYEECLEHSLLFALNYLLKLQKKKV